jgi:hypothetical protein
MFGTILENVVLNAPSRTVDFANQSITENTRASYPLHYIENHVPSGRGGHPKNVVFLTADAFGVLPPIAKLTPEQAMYYFLSGYTAKVAGTERGVTEPQATFSACFGAVFLVWHPTKYAEMLGELLKQHGSQVWLVNTGWSGGAYGTGKRMKLVGKPVAGKTGTSNDERDAWFIGISGGLVMGVWLGNDDGVPMDNVAGGGLPARLFRDILESAASERASSAR